MDTGPLERLLMGLGVLAIIAGILIIPSQPQCPPGGRCVYPHLSEGLVSVATGAMMLIAGALLRHRRLRPRHRGRTAPAIAPQRADPEGQRP